MSELPDPAIEEGFEDTASIDNDVETLFSRFITPIENMRSLAEAPPGVLQSNNSDQASSLKIDPNRPMESRTHAFYRMLGLPVIAGTSFYNPGFDPDNPKGQDARKDINSKIGNQFLNQRSQDRESYLKFLRTLFGRQDMAASLVAVAIGTTPKKFSAEAFSDPVRAKAISALKGRLPNIASSVDDASDAVSSSPIGPNFDGGLHILKPFQVDPAIDLTVMPSDNKVCVPFLRDKAATKISSSPESFLMRPGIEFILRMRLQDDVPDLLFLKDLQKVLTQEKAGNPATTADLSADTLRNTLFALADQNKIENVDIDKIFTGFGSKQATITKQLIQTIKVVIDELVFSYTDLDLVDDRISFLPIPPVTGPQDIGVLRDVGGAAPLEQAITILTIKKLNADRDVSNFEQLGIFATPFIFLEKTDVYEQQLSEKSELRKSLANRGLQDLRRIEIITGEVSGLGLVDILAIYTALWTIKIEELLGLLDSDSFNRLYDLNPDLKATKPVIDRHNGNGLSITESISALETRIGNILSFADNLLSTKFDSPLLAEGGEP